MALGIGILSKRNYSGFPPPLRSFWQRVRDDGGTMFDFNSAISVYRSAPTAILALSPSAGKAGTLYSVLPDGGAGDFTVARASATATRINKDSYIEAVAANVPRIDYSDGTPVLLTEPAATNLIAQSEEFGNSYWTKSGATIEGDQSTAGVAIKTYDFSASTDGFLNYSGMAVTFNETVGGETACLKAEKTGGAGIIYNPSELTLGKSNLFTFLFYVPSSNSSTDYILSTSLSSDNFTFTLTPDTWTEITINIPSYDDDIFFKLGTGNAIGDIFYIKLLNVYELEGFSCPMVDENGNNTLQGYKLVESATTGYHGIYSPSIVSSDKNVSIFAKGSERYLQIVGNASANDYVNFDLSDGTIGSSGTGASNIKIQNYGNGWYKCSVNFTTTRALFNVVDTKTATYSKVYTGDGTSGIYIFGAQLEEGSTATSYIQTTGTTETRNADVIQVALPTGVTSITLTDKDGVESAGIVADPYVIPAGEWSKIIME